MQMYILVCELPNILNPNCKFIQIVIANARTNKK